ncbi:MAG: hypothetical protein OIF56_11280 [Cohaesibacter sp.]|nr:hypothetical protein [Cohaesibacter sp.]
MGYLIEEKLVASEHDLKGLMKFAEREEWKECFAAVIDAHFGPILDEAELDPDSLADIVGPDWQGNLWGCAFEDFLTLEFDDSGKNIVDEYLKRQSWREKPPAKAYMKALRSSIMSLYEVSDVVPGESMKLRDLLRGSEPITVSEYSATQSLKQWDRLATRVINVKGKTIISGGLLPFSFEASNILFTGLNKALELEASQQLENLSDEDLQHLAPVFTLSWLYNLLEEVAFQQDPNLINSHGEPIEFHDMHFAFASRITQKQIALELNKVSALTQESAKFWNWVDRRKLPNKRSGVGGQEHILETMMDDGSRVLGNIELKGKALILSVNSAGRAKRGQELIERALGNMVRTPLSEIRTLKQMIEDAPDRPDKDIEEEIPPEIADQIMRRYLDEHYRKTLDEPIPTLNNETPRQASKTKAGRKQVVEWLKYLENSTANNANASTPMSCYDFGWMWEELGIKRQ